MVTLILTVLICLLLIVASELLWRRHNVDTEYTRKFVHVSVGSFVAFWPLFLTNNEIVALSAAFVVVVAISIYRNFFHAIHSVQRPTWGEMFFAMAVGALTFVTHDSLIYLAAVLHMSIADGFAAIVGTKYGRTTQYHMFGYPKSVAGTLTFFVLSLAILLYYAALAPLHFTVWLLVIAAAATVLENVSIRGFDNILVPLLVAVSLNALH